MHIRPAHNDDLQTIFDIEQNTFPPQEAACLETFAYRLKNFPECFFVAENDEGIIVAFLSGRPALRLTGQGVTDDMYENIQLPSGDTFVILSGNTRPDFQNMGYASGLLSHAACAAKKLGCRRMLLACKEEKLSFYGRAGYVSTGVSDSCHGGAVWYDMTMDL